MAEDYAEIKAEPGVSKDDMHPGRMRRFVTHLSAAAIKAEERSVKKQHIKEKIERIKSVSLNKRSTKQAIETELGSFESAVHDVLKDEEKILEEQRRETRQINELRRMVENLSRKLIDIGKEYAQELEEKDNKIMELREALASAHIRISESGEDRQKKIEDIEKRVKAKQREPVPEELKSKQEYISEIESHLRVLEQRHKDLVMSGQHTKADLDRLKRLIDTHKQSLMRAKGMAPMPVPAPAKAKPKRAKPKPRSKRAAKTSKPKAKSKKK
jgi:chromosome segregation ATPase